MKWMVRLGALALLLALSVSIAQACSCAPPPDAQAAMAQADAVFAGRVSSIIPRKGPGAAQVENPVAVTMQVHESWKGPQNPIIVLNTGINGMSCEGYFFEQGQDLLIYAYRQQDGSLGVHLCSRTNTLAQAQADIAALGPGFVPLEEAPAPAAPPAAPISDPDRIIWPILLGLGALAAGGGALILRRRTLSQR